MTVPGSKLNDRQDNGTIPLLLVKGNKRRAEMVTNQATGKQYCENRREIAQKYFNMFGDGISGVYAKGNMGILTLISDTQHKLKEQYWIEILNDIKAVLIQDDQKSEDRKEVTITMNNGKFYVNYYKDEKNFGMNEGTEDLAQVLKNVESGLNIIGGR